LDGADVAHLSDPERAAIRAHHIGFVFQAFHLVPYRSVRDNVELGLTYQAVRRRERTSRALEVIERVGLSDRTEARCTNLSGGEKQRVAIARALIREPSLLLCDEPTGNLDTANTSQVLGLLEDLNSRGLTVLIITHDQEVASRASRNLHMRDGALAETVYA
jgi:putative ABC transport system ATP-binding protein